MSLIEKIDRNKLLSALEVAKKGCKGLHEYVFFDAVMAIVDAQPILSEQKEPCTEPRICPKCQSIMNYDSWFKQMLCRQCGHMEEAEPKVVTMGDKIRESNESLAEFIQRRYHPTVVYRIKDATKMILDYLNQPYTES